MEEKKDPIKIRLSTAIMLFIIILLIIAIFGIIVYYNVVDSVNKDEKNANSINNIASELVKNEESIVNEIKTENNNIENLDINSESVQMLYKYVLKDNECIEEIAYQNQKVTSDNLDNKVKLLTVFENLDDEEADRMDKTKFESELEDINYYFSKEKIEEKAKMIFGTNVSIKHETLPELFATRIAYNNGEYIKTYFQGGGAFLWDSSQQYLIKAEKQGNEICLYDKYVHIYRDENNEEINDVYNASDKKVKLASKMNFETSGIYSGLSRLSENERSKKFIENIEKAINKKVNTFKHTFKQNADGKYYWYSTEPILQ